MWLSDEAHEKVRALGQHGNVGAVSYEMLTGTGVWVAQGHQVRNKPPTALPQVHDVALAAWDKINTGTEYQGSYTKVQQGPTEPYSDFIGRLEESIEKQVRGDQTQNILLHQLAFDNANEDGQSLIQPTRETGDIMEYLKACCNVGTFKHKTRVAALETMAMKKQKAKCFNCGKPGHMKKQCKLPAQNDNYKTW
jgi:hypothetical protein